MDRSRLHGIVHVVNSLDYGGLERVVADLAIEQHARGMDVQVFSICQTGGFRDALEAAGVPVTVAGKRRTLDLGVLRLLRRAAAGADIVHSHNFVPNYYAATAMRGLSARVEIAVATELPASWKPLVKAKMSASPMTSATGSQSTLRLP